MTIKLLTRECCNTLLSNWDKTEKNNLYLGTNFPKHLLNFIEEDQGIDLECSLELHLDKSDYENSRAVFEALKKIDLTQASDRRLWVSMTHFYFFEYCLKRWGINKKTTAESIKRRFHFIGAGLESRTRNAISRLWWAARLTYDESLEDPYKYTKILWDKQDYFTGLLERRLGTYRNVLRVMLELVEEFPKISEADRRRILAGLNAYGGVSSLSSMENESLKKVIIRIIEYANIKLE